MKEPYDGNTSLFGYLCMIRSWYVIYSHARIYEKQKGCSEIYRRRAWLAADFWLVGNKGGLLLGRATRFWLWKLKVDVDIDAQGKSILISKFKISGHLLAHWDDIHRSVMFMTFLM